MISVLILVLFIDAVEQTQMLKHPDEDQQQEFVLREGLSQIFLAPDDPLFETSFHLAVYI